MSRLTIVGAGRVGQTLGNLIVANRVVDVGQIYDRDIARARRRGIRRRRPTGR
ncbi:hypothetical protein QZM43_02585 [Burkholderia orbicola]|uniref:hypothetical protein n=1 Tax=Burkholderia cepacia complex TaxID=87882 RepID=UPI00201358D9|nr:MULTISPECIES: hypothetical protein [Burkholderia cepacia complex]MDN7471938.1 hypothetical protein [Burkholderia orbicola]MDN7501599.1 hypothetical protein [Burkholderia orbicola]